MTAENLRHRIEVRLLRLWFARSDDMMVDAGHARASIADRVLTLALAPWAGLAQRVARRRRARRLARGEVPARPLIVVGNLLVGGTGKTPATIALAQALQARGHRVGLLCGGYRAMTPGPHLVTEASDAAMVGDEAVLLAQATGLPTASGRARRKALDALLAAHPEIDLVVSDDGLQHEALPRTVELAVFDERGLGNGRMLPAGPLREPADTVAHLDALLLNGTDRIPCPHPRAWRFDIEPREFRHLASGRRVPVAEFVRTHAGAERIVALAGIGQPDRFFRALAGLGLNVQARPLADHARFAQGWADAFAGDLILMTDKDAVKSGPCTDARCWSLSIEARLPAAFIDWLMERLHGQPTA